MSILDNVEFIEHNQITAKDLWKDGVHLKESGKVFIAKNLWDLFFFCATAGLETQSLWIYSKSSHAKETSITAKNDSLLSLDMQKLIKSSKKDPNNVLICYLNINSLRYKVVNLRTLWSKFLPHYFVLAETKFDEGFPKSQFVIDHQYEIQTWWDRYKNDGG